MSLRRPRKLMNQINVVPYIDVMLVLLIIFMVTAPLVNPGQIDLPQVGQSLKPPVAPLEISIKEKGGLLLRDLSGNGKAEEVDREELVRAVKEKQASNPDQPVVISADKNVRYEEVLKVMDILQQNQVSKIGLLAKPKGR
ncbi:MAG: protein TolR [Sulfuricella sp.]|jgi:biopolymer transport protein TolR|nr:protein TolR [Sulfuricella sp.]